MASSPVKRVHWVLHRPRLPALLFAALLLAALTLSIVHIRDVLDGAPFWHGVFASSGRSNNLRQTLVRDAMLPRVLMSLLCGAALALAGTLAQQVLRNPLAEPMTLGVFPGAYLALQVVTIWFPAWTVIIGREGIALAGGVSAMLIVFTLSWRQRMASLAVILSGMIVNLYCGAIALCIAVSHFDLLAGLRIWGGGALDQTGWQPGLALLWQCAVCGAGAALLRRPLGVFETGDSMARNLGVSVHRVRFGALLIAVVLTACVVAHVGVIGFVGLAAPTLARSLGARRVSQRLILSPLLGAALLWITDEFVQALSRSDVFSAYLIPTGTVTALLGVPLLIALLPRLRAQPELSGAAVFPVVLRRARWLLPLFVAALLLGLLISFFVSKGDAGATGSAGGMGWTWLTLAQVHALAFWRIPHAVAAIAAGVLLAISGTLMQRVTGNPMASPDLLGVGSGGALGIVVVILAGLTPSPGLLFAACVTGAAITLCLLVWFGGRVGFAPARLLLIGMAISALFEAMVGALMSSGDPRAGLLMNFVVGSLYYVEPVEAYGAGAIALLSLCLVLLLVRWIEMLGLGETLAGSVGLRVRRARFIILLFAALTTAAATLLVGPLSFVGLVAPHVARLSGARRPGAQILLGSLFGAMLMVLAEWLGRQLAFPEEMPAGLVATLVGGPYLIFLTLRRSTPHLPR